MFLKPILVVSKLSYYAVSRYAAEYRSVDSDYFAVSLSHISSIFCTSAFLLVSKLEWNKK